MFMFSLVGWGWLVLWSASQSIGWLMVVIGWWDDAILAAKDMTGTLYQGSRSVYACRLLMPRKIHIKLCGLAHADGPKHRKTFP